MAVVVMGPEDVAKQENTVPVFAGQRLRGVTYFSLNVDGYQPIWNGPSGDSVDFGVDLDFDGHPLSVDWVAPTNDTEGCM